MYRKSSKPPGGFIYFTSIWEGGGGGVNRDGGLFERGGAYLI